MPEKMPSWYDALFSHQLRFAFVGVTHWFHTNYALSYVVGGWGDLDSIDVFSDVQNSARPCVTHFVSLKLCTVSCS